VQEHYLPKLRHSGPIFGFPLLRSIGLYPLDGAESKPTTLKPGFFTLPILTNRLSISLREDSNSDDPDMGHSRNAS